MTTQPNWKLIAQLGDAHPLEHGGLWVYIDTTGVYPPEAEKLDCPDEDLETGFTVHRFILEPCTYQNGILSDNRFHPDKPAWFADSIESLAAFNGGDVEAIISGLCGTDPIERAFAWQSIGEYHGFENLDQYPLSLTKTEVAQRYPKETWRV